MKWEEITEAAKILVVDDDPVSCRLVEQMLERGGYQHTWSTSSPSEGIELFRAIRPDLLLLDIHMSPLDGLELMRQLQENNPDEYLPIVVITADAMNETKLNALLVGAKDFITKPIDLVETMLRIRIQLETRFRVLELERTIETLRRTSGGGQSGAAVQRFP